MIDMSAVINAVVARDGVPGNGYLYLMKTYQTIAKVALITTVTTRGVADAKHVELEEILDLPFPDERGVFTVKGQRVSLVRKARHKNPGQVLKHVDELRVCSLEETYGEIIADALTSACAPVRRGTGAFDRVLFDTKLAAAFSSDRYSRNLPPLYNMSAADVWNRTIIIEDCIIDDKSPVPEGWEGALDLTTTPQSEKVCTVYTLAENASIVEKKIVPSNSLFDTTAKNGTFAPACAPTQMYKSWSTARDHVKLHYSEPPLCYHEGSDPELLAGINLLTAIVHDKYNQMDQLTISKSAAKRMSGWVYMAELVQVTSGGSKILVGEGDTIEPNQILATVYSAEGASEIRARRLVHTAVVQRIEIVERVVNSVVGEQTRIILRSEAPLVSGDKLMPRSGCKGCVVVVEDEEMPEVYIDGEWKRVELAVNPYPVAKRKNLSMLLEMAVNEAGGGEQQAIPVDVDASTLKDLYDNGFGQKKPAKKSGQQLRNPITAGIVWWMRSNSLQDYRTYGVAEAKENFQGLFPDRGRNSGVSYNMTFRMLLSEVKGCKTLDKVLMQNNFNSNITPLVADLVMMLEGDE